MIYVRTYIGQTRAAGWIQTLESYGFAEMVCRGELPSRRQPWAFDNGAFKDWKSGKPFNFKRYEQDIDWIWLHAKTRPDFIVAPDIVAGGLESLALSLSWVGKLDQLGPVYLVVQDGMEPSDVIAPLEFFAGLFVGGTVEWKHRTAAGWIALAHQFKKKAHIGRMGTEKKVRAALRWGADSIDSCLPLWSAANLSRFMRGFHPTHTREFDLGTT